MIDLHVHLLPGLDDGPGDLAEAAAMCKMAAADGIELAIVTTHQRHPSWPNEDRVRLRTELARVQGEVGPVPRLLPGAEIHVDSDLLGELDRFPAGPLLSLAGSHYLLLEFPVLAPGPDARTIVHELVVAGWRPVLAHPERIPRWAERPTELAELVELGAYLQVTAMSVTGEFGRRAASCCRWLLDGGMVDFVASDGHDTVRRPPLLSAARRAIAAEWGEETAWRLTVGNARAVLEDRGLEERA